MPWESWHFERASDLAEGTDTFLKPPGKAGGEIEET